MLGAFTDQAHNLILLAGDEARMLGKSVVEPEHLLLALSRRGTVQSLFAERGVTGSDVYAAVVGRSAVGDDLVGPGARGVRDLGRSGDRRRGDH
jgi:hypothetical protein